MSNSKTELVKLPEEQIKQEMGKLKLDWKLVKEGTELYREFEFKGYYKTIAFVNSVAWIAQQERHHPDLEVSYGKCIVRYTTHDANGLTVNDFKCVHSIEALGAE